MIDDELFVADSSIRKSYPLSKFSWMAVLPATIVVLTLLTTLYSHVRLLDIPPLNFPHYREIIILPGSTVREITNQLEEQQVVRSSLYLQYLLKKNHDDAPVQAGSYTFEAPLTSHEVAQALTTGTHMTPSERITFPEGFSIRDMHAYLGVKYGDEDISRLEEYEGYLFPDTYFVEEDATLDDIVSLMRENFEYRLEPYTEQIKQSDLTLEEVIILASILEREGNDETSMRTIAGILLTRLEIGMALQVDATLDYLLGKTSAELTASDLETDSPYNTYTNRGLPPTPISNPGLTAIEAALNPIESDYLYYLTGNDGEFYYARTFEEHKRNKERYLR